MGGEHDGGEVRGGGSGCGVAAGVVPLRVKLRVEENGGGSEEEGGYKKGTGFGGTRCFFLSFFFPLMCVRRTWTGPVQGYSIGTPFGFTGDLQCSETYVAPPLVIKLTLISRSFLSRLMIVNLT